MRNGGHVKADTPAADIAQSIVGDFNTMAAVL